MPPRIEIIGDAEKAAPFIIWAKQQWGLREGRWTKHVGDCLIQLFRSGDSGYIQFITQSNQAIVGNPHLKKDSQFVLDSYYGKIMSTPRPLNKEPYPSSEDKDIEFGNYSVLSKDDKAYTIKVPPHNLAADIGSSVKGYTQYSWTTNVSMEDVYTCYSEYVYSEGEAVFAGTMAPPEAAFKYSLIVGIGLDDKDVLHIAQLVQIPKDCGYWKIEKDGSNIGTFFGTFANASEKGAATLIWKNESDVKKWFIEFLTCDNGLESELVQNLNIYRREDVGRSTSQWFYKDGTWSQYTSSLPAKLKFDGIQEEAGLKKTRYSQVLDAALVNSKPVVANHVATSLSGVTGDATEITLDIFRQTDYGVYINRSVSPLWPASTDSYYHILSGDVCNKISVVVTGLPSYYEFLEIVHSQEYKIIRHKSPSGCSSLAVDGVIAITSSDGTITTEVVSISGTPLGSLNIDFSPGSVVIEPNTMAWASGGTAPYTWEVTNASGTPSSNGSSYTVTSTALPPIDSSLTAVFKVTDACGRVGTRTIAIWARWCLRTTWYLPLDGNTNCSDMTGPLYKTTYNGNVKTLIYGIWIRGSQEGNLDPYHACTNTIGQPCYGCYISCADNPGPWNNHYYYGSVSCDVTQFVMDERLIDSGWKYMAEYNNPDSTQRPCFDLPVIMQGYAFVPASIVTYEWVGRFYAC